MSADSQAPSSWSAFSGVPFCTCQDAQVWRRSCQQKPLIPARFKAFRQAFVFTCRTGLPSYVNTRVGCLPCCRMRTDIAPEFNGTEIGFLAFAWSAWIQANCLSRSTCDHSSWATFACRNPVAKVNRTISAKCSGNSSIRRAASSCVSHRTRRLGSGSNWNFGTLSSHSQSNAARRRIALTTQHPVYRGITDPFLFALHDQSIEYVAGNAVQHQTAQVRIKPT
jgi:hypothetical protein